MYSSKETFQNGLTGVMARCAGIKRDLRLNINTTYNDYFFLNCKSFISNEGDSYARFMLRFYEIIESHNIINQSLQKFKKKNINRFKDNILNIYKSENVYMEDTIKHFKT